MTVRLVLYFMFVSNSKVISWRYRVLVEGVGVVKTNSGKLKSPMTNKT